MPQRHCRLTATPMADSWHGPFCYLGVETMADPAPFRCRPFIADLGALGMANKPWQQDGERKGQCCGTPRQNGGGSISESAAQAGSPVVSSILSGESSVGGGLSERPDQCGHEILTDVPAIDPFRRSHIFAVWAA